MGWVCMGVQERVGGDGRGALHGVCMGVAGRALYLTARDGGALREVERDDWFGVQASACSAG